MTAVARHAVWSTEAGACTPSAPRCFAGCGPSMATRGGRPHRGRGLANLHLPPNHATPLRRPGGNASVHESSAHETRIRTRLHSLSRLLRTVADLSNRILACRLWHAPEPQEGLVHLARGQVGSSRPFSNRSGLERIGAGLRTLFPSEFPPNQIRRRRSGPLSPGGRL